MSRTFFASRPKNFVKRHFWTFHTRNPHLRTITQIARHLACPLATVSITPLPPPPPLVSPSSLQMDVVATSNAPRRR
ncbi:hypothetical protein K503DRAFT_776422 [Rhizopogon vinicolor AM-OR11-026]|uniref:Uncharacterized protein n=1 Tax=Rhizopogon vinicolor AM-OR11-026 TaxID=1314800 RepID=A0A1B7MJA5_9AGAM|nr:hypothetical protein K503DRAFT_776422 [Rhizopogon vinicolor AM-OR11-026]